MEAKEEQQVNMLGHYIKAISFENISFPTHKSGQDSETLETKIDMSIDISTIQNGNDTWDVKLDIKAKVNQQETEVFILSLSYIGVCVLKGFREEDELDKVLNIFCPNMIFPFARRAIADVTREGGYQPMLINGIDFGSIHAQKQKADPQPDLSGYVI